MRIIPAKKPYWAARRKPPILDHLIQESVNQAGGAFHPETGHYQELHYTGVDSLDRAKEIKSALYRSGKHLGYSVHAEVVRDGNGYKVIFRAIDKSMARKFVIDTYGPDRSKWPYDPRRSKGEN